MYSDQLCTGSFLLLRSWYRELEAGVVLVLGDHSCCGFAQDENGWGAFSEGLKIFLLTGMFIKKQTWRQQWRASAIPPAVQPTG